MYLVWQRGDVLQVRQASGQELRMPLVEHETQDGTAGTSQRFQKRASLVRLKAIISSAMCNFFCLSCKLSIDTIAYPEHFSDLSCRR